jgi:hypothetical protein
MMAGDDKKIQANPTPKNEGPAKKKNEGPAKKKSTSDASPSDATPSDATPSKVADGDTAAAAPAGYSRGEGQKPVTKAYRDNWDAIFGKKKRR